MAWKSASLETPNLNFTVSHIKVTEGRQLHKMTSTGSAKTTLIGSAFGTGNKGLQNAWDTYVGNTSVKSVMSPFGTGNQGFKNAWDFYVGKSEFSSTTTQLERARNPRNPQF